MVTLLKMAVMAAALGAAMDLSARWMHRAGLKAAPRACCYQAVSRMAQRLLEQLGVVVA